ncbi:hypothetical protein BJX63DRAFT_397103 [Aspergillus granulosus]|uniref:Zn(2)-C6 fungal-type domain-containing protein n=1 Tax=Aspergillus granulosus TaxID=176169 RepID=A0ABR4HAQ9_9EURO
MASRYRSNHMAVRRHVFKACEGCRQQKIKCSGESPCARCAKLSLPCVIRRVARQRQALARDSAQDSVQNDGSNALLMAFKSVRIRNETTGQTVVYGPTSTVALLHLIAHRTQPTAFPRAGSQQGVIHSCLSADAYDYGSLLPQQYHCSFAFEASLTPQLCMTTIPNDVLQFFLERYVITAWKLLPVQSPTQLQAVYNSSCRALSTNTAPPVLYPILLYQLAMGSLSTVQSELADMLAQEGELFASAGGYLSDELELQLNILMAQYHNETGSLNKAYSMLGHIAGRIYTTGLHIEPRAPAVDQLLRVLLSLERFAHLTESHVSRQTTDTTSYLCVALGRPPLLGPNLTVSNEGQPADVNFINGLFNIIKSILCVNLTPKATFDATSHMIWSTHTQLTSYWEEQKPTLLFAHANPSGPRRVEEGMGLTTILYEYAIIANLKPFLLYLGYSHITNRNENDPAFSERDPNGRDMQDLTVNKALDIILNSSKRIISIILGICQRGTVAKDLPMNSFFLETACISLVAYGLWCGDPSVVWESIDTGIKCLEELQYQRVAATRLAAVRATIEQSGLRRD